MFIVRRRIAMEEAVLLSDTNNESIFLRNQSNNDVFLDTRFK